MLLMKGIYAVANKTGEEIITPIRIGNNNKIPPFIADYFFCKVLHITAHRVVRSLLYAIRTVVLQFYCDDAHQALLLIIVIDPHIYTQGKHEAIKISSKA